MSGLGIKDEIIFIIEENCQGCNKCIRNCPVFGANISYTIDGQTKVKVDPEKCIHCGKCIEVCDHEARDYVDDTHRFFRDLQQGKDISIVIAPAARTNFPEYKRVIGYLKTLGARLVYDVSFGADITVWAYLKALKEKGIYSLIAQPCPAVVNYVEKHYAEILDYLAPVHSPLMCTAAYLRKYEKCQDALAFLSPCIGKIDEIKDPNTEILVQYNVTLKKFLEYLDHNEVDLSEYPEKEFDDPGCGLGYVFPRPGGLRENVEAKVDNAWVRQVEGQDEVYTYLHEYGQRIKLGKELPTIVDILNCRYGCNKGTGTGQDAEVDDIDLALEAFRREKRGTQNSRKQKKDPLFKIFNKQLKLEDFYRRYTRKDLRPLQEPTAEEYEEIFLGMHKDTLESRKINCTACGYQTCHDMAKAIYNHLDRPADCMDYNRKEVMKDNQELESKNEEINKMLVEVTSLSEERQRQALELTRRIHEITSSMEEVYKGNEDASKEIEQIGQEVREVVEMAEQLRGFVVEIKNNVNVFAEATTDIVGVARQTKILSLNAGIEAARSGEHGKGFNVLSKEIKRLAEESQKTAEEALVKEEDIHDVVLKVMEVIKMFDQKMEGVNMAIMNISAIIQEFTAQGEEMVASATSIAQEYGMNRK